MVNVAFTSPDSGLTPLFQIKDTWDMTLTFCASVYSSVEKRLTFCSKDLRIDSQVCNTMLKTKLVLCKYLYYLFSFLKGVQFNMQINDAQVHQYEVVGDNSLKFHESSYLVILWIKY